MEHVYLIAGALSLGAAIAIGGGGLHWALALVCAIFFVAGLAVAGGKAMKENV